MLGKTAVFFLHGSGGTGPELRAYLESMPIEQFGFKTFRQVCDKLDWSIFTPTSTVRPYTGSMNMKMNIWYDRSAYWQRLGFEDPFVDTEGLKASVSRVQASMADVLGDFDHAFLGGFSMGGGLSLNMLTGTLPDKLRGIFSLGSYCVQASAVLSKDLPEFSKSLPVLMMHGESDALIPKTWAENTATSLTLQGVNVQFRTFETVDHEIDPAEIFDLVNWMRDILRKRADAMRSHGNNGPNTSSPGGGNVSNQPSSVTEVHPPLNLETCVDDEGPGRTDRAEAEAVSSSSIDGCPLPYKVLPLPNNTGTFTLVFEVPEAVVPVMVSRPVLACGASFEITRRSAGLTGVQTQAVTSDPHATAVQIGRRLIRRLTDDPRAVNPCPMS